MKLIVALLVAACIAAPVFAQPPEIPPEVADLISETAEDYGVTPFGDPHLGELDDGESETIEIAVAADKLTFAQLGGDGDTIAIKVRALAGGKVVAESTTESRMPVLQIPAGSGTKVKLEVSMTCGYAVCAYFVQPFVR